MEKNVAPAFALERGTGLAGAAPLKGQAFAVRLLLTRLASLSYGRIGHVLQDIFATGGRGEDGQDSGPTYHQGDPMSALLRFASSLGLVLTLAGFAGCSSAPGGTVPQRAPELPSATVATTPTEKYLAMLILEAGSAPLYAEPSTSSPVVATLSSGEQLFLIQRTTDWFRVRADSGVIGFIQPSALVEPCTTDRAEPRILEAPLFAFKENRAHGSVVIEAELDANARILNTRVLENSLGDPAFEQEALADLQRIRFLPPTKDCKPRPFFYTFTRQF